MSGAASLWLIAGLALPSLLVALKLRAIRVERAAWAAASGNACVTGHTTSAKFPTTTGAWDRSLSGANDGLVTKLDAMGSRLLYSTYLGGNEPESGFELGKRIRLDSSANAVILGATAASDFPTTADALDATLGGARDAMIAKLSPSGSTLVFGSYFGGTLSEQSLGCTYSNDFAVLYLAGFTTSQDFPTFGDPYPFQSMR